MGLGDTLLQPENFGKFFHGLFENNNDAKRKHGNTWKKSKLTKKNKNKSSLKNKAVYKTLDGTLIDPAVSCAPDVEIPTNASQFAVYFAVRGAILERWMRQAAAVFVNSSAATPNNDLPIDIDSDTDDITQSHENTPAKIPKIVGIGLCSVFELIRESRSTHPALCTKALHALLDVIQGQHPEELKLEPEDTTNALFQLLLDLATSHGPAPSAPDDGRSLQAVACACLLGLVTVRGDTGKILQALGAMLMCPRQLAAQNIRMPAVLVSLQRSVHAVLLEKSTRPDFLTHGIPAESLVDSFYLDADCLMAMSQERSGSAAVGSGDAVSIASPAADLMAATALASDGKFLYALTARGLLKFGTGYAGTVKGFVYACNKDVNCHAWIGFCNNTLYYKQAGNTPLCEINRDSLQLIGSSDQYSSGRDQTRTSSVMFSDGENLGIITASKDDAFIVRTLNSSTPLDLPLKLARKRLDVLGGNANELLVDIGTRQLPDSGGGVSSACSGDACAVSLPGEEDIAQICAGKEFVLARGNNGKVYFSGKSSVLGIKMTVGSGGKPSGNCLCELNIPKNPRVVQIAVGHEGQHAVLVMDDGSAYFTGTSRRGEDGDQVKVRRQPRPSKPKKMTKVEAHHIVQAACNNGTTALVTRNGALLMFGKDTVHCDQATGLVVDLRNEFIVQVALGKAHAVAINSKGAMFTFGINNKGQCGREYVPYVHKEAHDPVAMETSAHNLGEPEEQSPYQQEDEEENSDAAVCQQQQQQQLSANNPSCSAGRHSFRHDYCMVCTTCNECTGYGTACLSSKPDRKPGMRCGCGVGDSGCKKCGVCRVCALDGGSNIDLELALNGLNEDSEIPAMVGTNYGQSKNFEDNHKSSVKKSYAGMRNHMVRYKRGIKGWPGVEEQNAGSDADRDATRVSLLSPARLRLSAPSPPVPPARRGGDKRAVGEGRHQQAQAAAMAGDAVTQVACGLHHTVALTQRGYVYTFGSNQYGQLGMGDLQPHSGPQRVPINVAIMQVAAGSNHTILLSVKGEVYCFGNYQKGQFGMNLDHYNTGNSTPHKKNAFIHCSPVMLQHLGPHKARKATWIGANGDQTFVKFDESLINASSLCNSIVVANKNSIILFPKYSTTSFKCLVINKRDGTCISSFPLRQADLNNRMICLDPVYGVLWTYGKNGKISCYNLIASETRNLAEIGKNEVEKWMQDDDGGGVVVKKTSTRGFRNKGLRSIFNAELCLPIVSKVFVSRSQAAINLLCCLDTLNVAQDLKMSVKKQMVLATSSPGGTQGLVSSKPLSVDDYQMVNRFDSHGGGWGYSGHAVEAIRFMCDTEVMIGGFGLFGGRGEYTGKIKLLDLGMEGGEQETDGELLAETEEAPYECAPRTKRPVMFEEPVHVQANRWYLAWARVSGPSSDCGASGQHLVITDDQIQFSFKSSKKSNNGTDVNAGQIPVIYYRVISNEVQMPPRQNNSSATDTPIHILSKDFARSVTKDAFQALISLLQWSWCTFKMGAVEAMNQSNTHNLSVVMQELEKLVYISKACLRLLRTYINDIYPSQVSKKFTQESLSLAECIGDVRLLLMQILSDSQTTTDACGKTTTSGKSKLKNFNTGTSCRNAPRLNSMAEELLEECHRTFIGCYHAFYPTANLKWQCLCDLLVEMDKDNQNYNSAARLLSAVLEALCSPSVRLRSTLPVLSAKGLGEPCHKSKLSPSDNAGLPMVTGIDGHHYPILVEQMSYRSHLEKNDFVGWQFKDVLDRLLEIVTSPVKRSIRELVKQKHTTGAANLIGDNQNLRQTKPGRMKRNNYIENIGMSNNSNDPAGNSNCNDIQPIQPPRTLPLAAGENNSKKLIQTNPGLDRVSGLVINCCHLLARVVAELAYQCTGSDEDLMGVCGRAPLCTPSRFTRSNQTRTWNTGNGAPEAICFSVDRPGLSIVGAVIYGGAGCYDYELEILDFESESPTINSSKPYVAHRWNSLQMVKGTIGPEDYSKKDMADILFEKAVPIKENRKYAIRLRNHGGRTNNGDGGIGSVVAPCGATFQFSTCSLSFNGTTQTRGQIPSLLYYSNPTDSDSIQTSRTVIEQQARKSTLEMVTTITHCCRNLLIEARDQVGKLDGNVGGDGDNKCAEDADEGVQELCRNLGDSSLVNTLMPLVFAHVVPLLGDARSSVQVLSLIQELLPHVSALNLLSSIDAFNSKNQKSESSTATSSNGIHYALVESEHPYKASCIVNYRVRFPPSVKWMVLEFDPKCGTVQPEDTLELFVPKDFDSTKEKEKEMKVQLDVVKQQEDKNDQPYWPVLHKMSNIPSQWPTSGVILPGREVIFSLETASNYLKDDRTNTYGFKCQVIGYEMPHSTNGLQLLENELAHLGGMCAASLIRKDLVLPSVSDESESDMENSEEVSLVARLLHGNLLSRGLAMSQTPTIQQALDGVLPLSTRSNGRQFLRDFVTGPAAPPPTRAASDDDPEGEYSGADPSCSRLMSCASSGARLAAWLQPESRICPDLCFVQEPNRDEVRQGWSSLITVVTRDQYGDLAFASDLKVSLKAVPVDKRLKASKNDSLNASNVSARYANEASMFGGHAPPQASVKYEPTVRDKMCFKSITIMKAYANYSFEEIRLATGPASYSNRAASQCPASETIRVTPVKSLGSYAGTWTPTTVGDYHLVATVDGYQLPKTVTVRVLSPPAGTAPPPPRRPAVPLAVPPDVPAERLLRFTCRPSAGLRIRAHPSLQSEQLAVVGCEQTIAFVDEVHNDDGVWVRLSPDTVREYCSPDVQEAWCLQFNRHLSRVLLTPVVVQQPQLASLGSKLMIDGNSPELPAPSSSGVKGGRKQTHSYIVTQRGVFAPQRAMRSPCLNLPSDVSILEGEEITIREYVINEEGAWGRIGSVLGMQMPDDEAYWLITTSPGPGGKFVLDERAGLVHQSTTPPETQTCAIEEGAAAEKQAFFFAGDDFRFQPVQSSKVVQEVSAPPSTASPAVVYHETNPFIFGDVQQQQQQNKAKNSVKKLKTAGKQESINTTPPPIVPRSGLVKVSEAAASSSSPPKSVVTSQKSITSTSASSICSVGNAINSVVGSGGTKFQALQKWFKGEEGGKNSGSDKKKSDSDKSETNTTSSSGISVRDLVRAIGSNGNQSQNNEHQQQPQPTPKRRNASGSSSPVTIPGRTDRDVAGSSSPRSIAVSPLVSGTQPTTQERRGSTLSDTSALVSSLTRDLSQSPSPVTSQAAMPPAGNNSANQQPAVTSSPASSCSKSEDLLESPRKMAQTGTQTSPENSDVVSGNTAIRSHFSIGGTDRPTSPKSSNKQRQSTPKSKTRISDSPRSAFNVSSNCGTDNAFSDAPIGFSTPCFSPASGLNWNGEQLQPKIVKEALSPSVAESLRAVFAAFLWHEGIVHDAMACASFLKFHPSLPKEGALVPARSLTFNNQIPQGQQQYGYSSPNQVNVAARQLTKEERARQRHSAAEVTGAGYYGLNQLQPGALDALTRSAANAAANRSNRGTRKNGSLMEVKNGSPAGGGNGEIIKEEVVDSSPAGKLTSLPEMMSVLPPALRSIVLLWEQISTNYLNEFKFCESPCITRPPMPSLSPTIPQKTPTFGNSFNSSGGFNNLGNNIIPLAKDSNRYNNERARLAKDMKSTSGKTLKLRKFFKKTSPIDDPTIDFRSALKPTCELCPAKSEAHLASGMSLTRHMRAEHPGCSRPADGRGYNSAGVYCRGWSGNCGEGGTEGSSWYLLCDVCRLRYLYMAGLPENSINTNAAAGGNGDTLHPSYKNRTTDNSTDLQPDRKLYARHALSPVVGSGSELHEMVKQNAMFLLELASAANSGLSTNNMSNRRLSQTSYSPLPSVRERTMSSAAPGGPCSVPTGVSPPDPSPWTPLPPFQCLQALGTTGTCGAGDTPPHFGDAGDALGAFCADEDLCSNKRHSMGPDKRPLSEAMPSDFDYSSPDFYLQQQQQQQYAQQHGGGSSRFHRSVSMGLGGGIAQESGQPAPTSGQVPVRAAAGVVMRKRNYSGGEMNNDAGSSLLCYPSPNLQRLVPEGTIPGAPAPNSDSEEVFHDPNNLWNRPTLNFLIQHHDLNLLRLAMKQAIRKATCRIYALQAMNWLLRSVTQPSCLHDLLWWFVYSLNPSQPEQEPLDDACDMRQDDMESTPCSHPVSDLSHFAGEQCTLLANAFHSLLRGVAALTLALPAGSPLQTQAIRCWAVRFTPSDHAFLHRSHVFGNISKILSRSEEEAGEDAVNSLCENHSMPTSNAVTVEWLQDVTQCVELRCSSRQAMSASLVDESTETFWESGDEDRNRPKHIDLVWPEEENDRTCPKAVYVHVDNTRDIGNKVSVLSFFNGVNFSEMKLIKSVDVESRSGAWIVCFLPDKPKCNVRIEAHGPDNSLRIRQIRVLGYVMPAAPGQDKLSRSIRQHSAASVQRRNCETETLKVFRLITSQVFGKLILGESVPENINYSMDREQQDIDSSNGDSGSLDLREHMVGILFSRSKLTHLQKQVIVHIVQAIRKEAIRARVEWETFLCTPCNETSVDENASSLQHNSSTQHNTSMAHHQQHSSTDSLTKSPDNYCFEMLSMVLALSGSSVGRTYLSHQHGLLRDLFSLLHTGSARVQRQVTSLLRRILPDVAPSALCAVISVSKLPPQDYGVVTSDKDQEFNMHQMGILDVFLGCVAKALTVQVKTQSRSVMVATLSAYLGSTAAGMTTSDARGDEIDADEIKNSVTEEGARWWLAGDVASKQAEGIIKLLKDMAAGKLSEAWANVTKAAVAEAILNLTRLDDKQRAPQACLRTPTLWLALGALCVLDTEHVEKLSSGRWSNAKTTQQNNAAQTSDISGVAAPPAAPPGPTCSNHDDGETRALVLCAECGALCAECDRVLHLPRKARDHMRTVCKEEVDAVRVDLHEGCGRAKLFWLLALTDASRLKALVEFRDPSSGPGGIGGHAGFSVTGPGLNQVNVPTRGVCRFCGTKGDTGLLAIGNVCADEECQEYARNACCKRLACGHLCGGIADEQQHLPCLHGCDVPIGGSTQSKGNDDSFKNPWGETAKTGSTDPKQTQQRPRLTQDADDMCMICFTEALSCAPSLQLSCGHVFHAHCCRNVLSRRWPGPRITFAFSQCPICKSDIEHEHLNDLITPIRELYADVKRKALMRLEYEGLLDPDSQTISQNSGMRYHGNATAYAMDRYAYYVCHKCNKAYYGGEARCDIANTHMGGAESSYDARELACGACSDVSRARTCPRHGTDFLEYKCRYCCSVAVFFCFGTTHFCNACHEDFQRVANVPPEELPVCPAGPKAIQLEGDECPLHIKHPPTGEEFALGCGVCRNAHTF